jgi:hypothetical protein
LFERRLRVARPVRAPKKAIQLHRCIPRIQRFGESTLPQNPHQQHLQRTVLRVRHALTEKERKFIPCRDVWNSMAVTR